MDRSFIDRADASRARLTDLLGRFSDAALATTVGDWSGTVLLAHMAFWDRMVLVRWQHAARDGRTVPTGLDAAVADLINDAMVAEWRLIPGPIARLLAMEAAEAVDAHIAQLDDPTLEASLAAGLVRLVDRSIHRTLHLDDLERALAGTG